MNWLDELNKQLKIKREKLLLGIKSAKVARDQAPSAMESHSDTSRSEKEKLINAFENDLKVLDEIILSVPNNFINKIDSSTVTDWKYIEIYLNEKLLKICIVPEGIGGEMIEDMRLLSSESPLGKALINKKKGDIFSFNGQEGKIEDIK